MLDEDNKPEDLTGATATLGIKENLDDPTMAYEDTVNVTADDKGNLNTFIFIIPSNITEGLIPLDTTQAYYHYAIDVLDSNSNNTTVLTGRIIVKKNVLS
jgi:hypothetical protein